MPRAARLDTPGALQHVMARGIERREIFSSDRDRADWLFRLATCSRESGARILAWALWPSCVAAVSATTSLVPALC